MNIFAFFSLFSFVSLLAIGFSILSRNPKEDTNRLFAWFCLSMSLSALSEYGLRTSYTFEQAVFWSKIILFTPLSSSLLLHFSLVYTNRIDKLSPISSLVPVYFPALILIIPDLFTGIFSGAPVRNYWGYSDGSGSWYLIPMSWNVLAMIISFVLFFRFSQASNHLYKKREVCFYLHSIGVVLSTYLITDVLFKASYVNFPDLTLFSSAVMITVILMRIWRRIITPAIAADKILKVIPDGLFFVNPQGFIIQTNESAVKLLECEREEILNTRIALIFAEDGYDSRVFRMAGDSKLEKFGKFNDVDAKIKTKKGKIIPVSLSESLIYDKREKLLGSILLARDMSERIKVEEELEHAQKLKILSTIAGGIAHDFNNVLSAILGNIGLSKLQIDGNDRIITLLESAEKALQVGAGLSRQLLTFTKEGTPDKKVTSLNELIRETVEFSLRGCAITCRFEIPDDLWPVNIDRNQISEVVMNITLNARDAMERAGNLIVICRNLEKQIDSGMNASFVAISFRDCGPGIPKDQLGKIFEPFFTSKEKGSGLGLAVSLSVVKQHEGFIDVDSRVGVGTTFTVTLPALPHAKPAELGKPVGMMTCGKKVLVMDDEESVRNVTSKMLQFGGHYVHTAREGGEAIQMYLEKMKIGDPFDVVVIDVTVKGGIGGADTIKRLREIDPKVKAVVYSGYSAEPVLQNHLEYGFAAALAKPATFEELMNAIDSALA